MDTPMNESDFIFYRGEDGNVHAQVVLGGDTVWISQSGLAGVFGIDRTGIGKHIKNVFDNSELDEKSVSAKIAHTASDGKIYNTTFYSLDLIIAVGYRINSYKATKFRQWATKILKDYLIKGFVLDDERLKQGNKLFGQDYFQELLERIQAIRASEKMFYEKIRDLYATSVDYDTNDPATQKFFAKVQNKVEYAIVKKTSAETILAKANALLPNMGLRTWKNIKREGNIQKSDVSIAKNYFSEDEIKQLNSLINMYLDFAKLQIVRNKIMKMSDWESRLDAFLTFNEFPILSDAGSVKKEIADRFAEQQYSKFKTFHSTDFKNISENIHSTGIIPKEEAPPKKEPLSDFNKKLETALNYDPDKKKQKTPKPIKPPKIDGKVCPKCGAVNDKKANYCNADITNEEGDVISCGHSFNAINGSIDWD